MKRAQRTSLSDSPRGSYLVLFECRVVVCCNTFAGDPGCGRIALRSLTCGWVGGAFPGRDGLVVQPPAALAESEQKLEYLNMVD